MPDLGSHGQTGQDKSLELPEAQFRRRTCRLLTIRHVDANTERLWALQAITEKVGRFSASRPNSRGRRNPQPVGRHDAAGSHTEVYISRQRNLPSPTIKRELRRRSAIEPVIGPLKRDGLLERNHLAGERGDAINAILAAAGHNLPLVLAWLRCFVACLVIVLGDRATQADTGLAA